MVNSNVLEFFVKMKDFMSGGLAKIAQNVRSTNRDTKIMTGSVNELKQRLHEVNQVRFGTVLRSEFRSATQEAKNLERQISSMQGKRSSGGGLMGLARQFAPALSIASLLSFGMGSVRASNAFEAQKKSFGVLAGSTGIGNQLGSDLRDLKENTIMGPAVYKNAQTMLGFGVGAKEVVKDLRMLGDISMGDANRLQHLTLAFSEVQAAGKLTGKEVRQFVNAGFNPLMQISEMTHKSMAKVRDRLHEGKISAEEVKRAFEAATGPGGRFYDMLNKMSETAAGKTQMLEGRIASLKIAVGERLQPVYVAAVDTLSSLVGWTKKFIEVPVTQKLYDQISSIRGLQTQLMASNVSHQRQVDILNQLRDINPNITKGISDQSIEYAKLAQNIDNVVGSLKAKLLAEQFTKDNAGVLDQYGNAQKNLAGDESKIFSIVGTTVPELLNKGLSKGQLIRAAREKLLAQVMGESGVGKYGKSQPLFQSSTGSTFRLNDESDANKNLMALQLYTQTANRNVDVINRLGGKVAGINNTKSALLKQFDEYSGIASMSAAGIKGGGKTGSSVNAGDEGSEVTKGITSGGPRVINIHGVKFMDKMEVHASSPGAAVDEMEPKLLELFRRILNSGASVQ